MQGKYSTNIKINKVGIEFTTKKITAYGGFSLLALFFEKIKLRENLEKIIPINESSPNSMGVYSKILAYILVIYAGGNRFSHLLYLGCEGIMNKLFAVAKLPLASTTLTRLFRKIRKQKESEEMSEGLWGYLSELIPWKWIKEDWLTFDSTVLERYGKQEGAKRGYNPKKKGRGSHSPLLAFLNNGRYVVNLWNRPGNVASWNNMLGFFQNTWQRVECFIKIKGIIADSGFYLRELIELLEQKATTYIIAARLYHPLQMKIYSLQDWQEVAEGIMGKELSLFGNEIDMNEYRYSVWITNSSDTAYEVWKQCRPRANDENIIKELKEDFALGGFSMKYFYSTESAMLIRVFIYNLFVLFRYEILGQKEKIERLKTLRYKYYVLPAQTAQSSGTKSLTLS